MQPTILPLDTAVPTVDPSGAAADGLFDASQGLVDTTCAASGGAWSFAGRCATPTVSPTTSPWRSPSSDLRHDRRRHEEVPVAVAAGASAPVGAPAFHEGDIDGVECLTGVTVKEQ